MTLFALFCSTVFAMPSKFPITDPVSSPFLEAYSPIMRRSFNGAIWAGEILIFYSMTLLVLQLKYAGSNTNSDADGDYDQNNVFNMLNEPVVM